MAYTAWPTGVVVSDPIVRPEEAIYGTHYDYMGVGGWISVPTLADMYLIPNHPQIINADGISSGQRKLGMVVKITDLNSYYEFDIVSYNSLTVAQKLVAFADNNNFKTKIFGNGGQINYQDVTGLDTELAKKVDKTSIVNVASQDATKVVSAKGLDDALKYTIASTGITVGGLNSGSTINGKSIKEVFDMIFAAPFQAGSSSMSLTINNQDPGYSSTTREYGNADIAATITWYVNKRTNTISTINVDGTSITLNSAMTASGFGSQTGTLFRNVGLDGSGIQSFSMAVQDSAGTALGSSSNTIDWYHRRYWGTSATVPTDFKTGLSNGTILINSYPGFASQFGHTRALNNNYNCTGGKYIYYLFPKDGGTGISANKGFAQVTGGVLNGVNAFSSFACESVTLTDRFSVRREYFVFYTGFQTGSNVNINVS